MKYQEQFPTIWDTPLKTKAGKAPKADERKLSPASLKEAFLTIWDTAKRKPAA
ncbi:hypothetical protein [Vreelandella olivaria]|uniref:hypothetical protein n=1 Tax=Vreelandella olivaria TaxID=390919 RepID=UPI00201EC4B5|nr:hypothetical protein [Halomonas olivaria]